MKNNTNIDDNIELTLKLMGAIINNAIDKEAIAGNIVMTAHELKKFFFDYMTVTALVMDAISQMVDQTKMDVKFGVAIMSFHLEKYDLATLRRNNNGEYLKKLINEAIDGKAYVTYETAIDKLSGNLSDIINEMAGENVISITPTDYHEHDCDNCATKGNCPIEGVIRIMRMKNNIENDEFPEEEITNAVLDSKLDPRLQDDETLGILNDIQSLLASRSRLEEIDKEMELLRNKPDPDETDVQRALSLRKEALEIMNKFHEMKKK